MTTLDRYIARQYLFNVIALMVLLFSFVVTVDVTLNLDRFMERAEKIEVNAARARAERANAAAGVGGVGGVGAKAVA